MSRNTIAGALLACALQAPAVGWAQDAPATLAGAVEAAWSRAVEAAESTGHGRRADAALLSAQAPWAAAPSLQAGQRRDRSGQGNGRETEVGLTVPLWLPGQRSALVDAASAEQKAARAAREVARLKVAAQVREAQGNYYLQQAELAAAQAQLRTLSDLARTDSLVASAEQLSAQASVVTAQHGLAAALSRWRALTGLSQVAPPEAAPAQYPVSVADGHAALAAANLAVQVAQRRLDAVESARRDPPEVTIGARHETPAGGAGSARGIGVSLRVPFATDSRNRPLVANALSELELARARESRLRVELASELEIAHAGLDAARRNLADEERRVRLLRERFTLLDRSWRAGNTGLPDLLRALTAAAAAEGELQRSKAALDLAHARVQQALGILP
jgi:outer membrane protein TolC